MQRFGKRPFGFPECAILIELGDTPQALNLPTVSESLVQR